FVAILASVGRSSPVRALPPVVTLARGWTMQKRRQTKESPAIPLATIARWWTIRKRGPPKQSTSSP
ncbi:MAG: hypothetical protein ACK56G_10490, partial [Pirellulaceae bacterium]